MCVRIGEAGKHGGFREVNHFNARGRNAARTYGHDFVAFDENHRVRDGRVALAVNEASCFNRNLLRRRGFLLRSERDREKREQTKTSDNGATHRASLLTGAQSSTERGG